MKWEDSSRNTRRAVRNYGLAECLRAYQMHIEGEGASTIAHTGPRSIGTTQQADAAINAGRELQSAWRDAFPGWRLRVTRHAGGYVYTAEQRGVDHVVSSEEYREIVRAVKAHIEQQDELMHYARQLGFTTA